MSDMPLFGFYNSHAKTFTASTQTLSLEDIQQTFLSYLKPGSSILDFGCGSGRDSKYFLEHQYSVTAIDGSEKLCQIASDYTGLQVKQMLFQELADIAQYDGIWACASILHLPYLELKSVLLKMAHALKENGIIYASFKYGIFEGERNGRYFTDMTEERIHSLIREIDPLQIEKQWISNDVRKVREEELWLNVILRLIS